MSEGDTLMMLTEFVRGSLSNPYCLNLVIAEKDGIIDKLEKEKRSATKMVSMAGKSMRKKLM